MVYLQHSLLKIGYVGYLRCINRQFHRVGSAYPIMLVVYGKESTIHRLDNAEQVENFWTENTDDIAFYHWMGEYGDIPAFVKLSEYEDGQYKLN